MIGIMVLFILLLVVLILSFCFHLVGGLLKLLYYLVIGLPCALLCFVFGIVLCCTVICIPLGMGCFKLAGLVFSPFRPRFC